MQVRCLCCLSACWKGPGAADEMEAPRPAREHTDSTGQLLRDAREISSCVRSVTQRESRFLISSSSAMSLQLACSPAFAAKWCAFAVRCCASRRYRPPLVMKPVICCRR
eukprot:3746945-Rhodomonas_salina.2